MKTTSTFLPLFCSTFLLFGFAAPALAQEMALASNGTSEPLDLYRKVNESLTEGKTKLALNIFDEVVEFYEHEGRLKELPGNYLGMALSLALNGNYSESIRYHKKALRAHRKYKASEPNDEIRVNLGLAYQLAGKERKAKRLLN
jgi:tetratricopeptide (TPR) repeat protein